MNSFNLVAKNEPGGDPDLGSDTLHVSLSLL